MEAYSRQVLKVAFLALEHNPRPGDGVDTGSCGPNMDL
jgi:hypothetical protein